MIDKCVGSIEEAVADLRDDSVVLVSGFGDAGMPFALVEGILSTEARNLTLVANNAGWGERGLAALFREHRVSRIICSYPKTRGSIWFEKRYFASEVELELVPQGTLSERIRAGGAGIGAFFTPTSAGTQLAEGKETRVFNGVTHVLEYPIRGDVALLRGQFADRWGNLTYRAAGRNFGPTMAMAADVTIAEVERIVQLGDLRPEEITTASVFVDRVVEVDDCRIGT